MTNHCANSCGCCPAYRTWEKKLDKMICYSLIFFFIILGISILLLTLNEVCPK